MLKVFSYPRVWYADPANELEFHIYIADGEGDKPSTAQTGEICFVVSNGKRYMWVVDTWNEQATSNGSYEPMGAVATHAGQADPHTGYQRESEKNQAGGYAGLDGSSKLTGSQQVYGSSAGTACEGNDSRLSDSRTPSGNAGGQLGGTYPNPDVRGLRETGGPTSLTLGAIADGQYLRRSGSNLVGGTPSGGGEAFPVGSVFIAVVSTNPATLLGYGTWAAFGAGRVMVGLDSGDADFDTVRETGGAKTHTLSVSEMPSHTHTQDSHNHIQDAHSHAVTDPGHTHLTQRYPTATGGPSGFTIDTSMSGTLADNTLPTKSATTGVTVNNQTPTNQAATATNQNTGGGGAHNNLQPYIVVCMWERTA